MNEATVRRAFRVADELAQKSPGNYEAIFQAIFMAMLQLDEGEPSTFLPANVTAEVSELQKKMRRRRR